MCAGEMVVKVAQVGDAGQSLPASPTAAQGEAAAAETPRVRGVTAEYVGNKLGKEPRTVNRWTERETDPCPCDRKMKGKVQVLRYNLDEVIEWCTRNGIKLEAFEAKGMEPIFSLDGEVRRQSSNPQSGKSEPDAPEAVDYLAGVEIGEERAAFRGTLSDLRRRIAEVQALIREKNAAGLSHSQIKGLTDAAARASEEIRRIDDHEREAAKERGELVDRAWAVEAIGALSGDYVSSLTRLEVVLGPAIKAALAEAGALTPEAAGEGERVERIIRNAVRIEADRERAKMSAGLREAAETPAARKEAA